MEYVRTYRGPKTLVGAGVNLVEQRRHANCVQKPECSARTDMSRYSSGRSLTPTSSPGPETVIWSKASFAVASEARTNTARTVVPTTAVHRTPREAVMEPNVLHPHRGDGVDREPTGPYGRRRDTRWQELRNAVGLRPRWLERW